MFSVLRTSFLEQTGTIEDKDLAFHKTLVITFVSCQNWVGRGIGKLIVFLIGGALPFEYGLQIAFI